jgi:hypothetical protein
MERVMKKLLANRKEVRGQRLGEQTCDVAGLNLSFWFSSKTRASVPTELPALATER